MVVLVGDRGHARGGGACGARGCRHVRLHDVGTSLIADAEQEASAVAMRGVAYSEARAVAEATGGVPGWEGAAEKEGDALGEPFTEAAMDSA